MFSSETEDIGDICEILRASLERAVQRQSFDGTTLSGGLDTSIVNFVASKQRNDIECVSVGFGESSMEDLEYAKIVSDELNLENHVHIFDFSEAKEAAREVVRITRSFDPVEIRNSISIYIAMREAKELGMSEVLTGDGADELFAGYSFLYNMNTKKLEEELEKIWEVMSFSSQSIAESLGMSAELPYLDEEFREFAIGIEPDLKVGDREGKRFGKWILRRAYEGKLPDEIVWREKVPIEMGTGTTIFPKKFRTIMDEEYFESARREIKSEEGVIIRSEEQLFYYEIYKSAFGSPGSQDPEGRTCFYCGTNVPGDARFCRTCGGSIEER